MNFRGMNDFRDKRNQYINMPFNQMHYSIASYCTDSTKKEMKATFGDDFLNHLPMVPDPLRKNLADTLITAEVPKKVKTKSFLETEIMGAKIAMEHPENQTHSDRGESHTFSSITGFISGVFNVLSSAMFRTKPDDQLYDYNYPNERQRSPDNWQTPNIEDQNINERAHEQNREKETQKTMDINNDYRATVTSCEAKLNQVRTLLNTKPVQNDRRFRPRRPKKQFVDVGAYEEDFEDAFTAEDLTSNLARDPIVEHICPTTYESCERIEIDGPITRTHITPQDEKNIPPVSATTEKCNKITSVSESITTESITVQPSTIISSCEDKLSRLKALLQEKKSKKPPAELDFETKPEMTASEPKHIQKPTASPRIHDKHYKNQHRTTNKRQKANLHRTIQEDLLFANEIDPDGGSSVENSPPVLTEVDHLSETPSSDQTDYFDEVKGRFRNSSTTESDDSFQIVFSDTPPRTRKVSECDSEDSFIVFDDSPQACYVSTDVFGETPSEIESDYSDSDSDVSDSGCNLRCNKLSPHLSRTISDLTDDSLYEEPGKDTDQVDCAFKTAVELPIQDIVEAVPVEKRKCKKVHFSPQPPKVHVMRVWAFAARQARAGHWERLTLDRERFKRRIADVEMAVSWVLKPQHRSRVIFQRFMPWWNAQRRKEIAEKKEEERKRQQAEDEAKLNEERKRQEDAKLDEERKEQETEDGKLDGKDEMVEVQTVLEGKVVKSVVLDSEIIDVNEKNAIESDTVNEIEVTTEIFNARNENSGQAKKSKDVIPKIELTNDEPNHNVCKTQTDKEIPDCNTKQAKEKVLNSNDTKTPEIKNVADCKSDIKQNGILTKPLLNEVAIEIVNKEINKIDCKDVKKIVNKDLNVIDNETQKICVELPALSPSV